MLPPKLPPPVFPGDRVGVAALSGVVEAEALEAGLEALRGLGYEPVPAANLLSRDRIFAGTDDERLEGFHQLVADPSLSAIFFARGGHGVLRLLPRIDWQLVARRPRAYVGYSDLVPFLLEAVRRLDLVTFHGPMVAVDLARPLEPEEEESLRSALEGRLPAELPLTGVWGGGVPADSPNELDGAVEGPLVGGCLSMLVATLGTPYAVSLEGALFFWEDVNEPLYRLDRMLTQFRLSHRLGGIRGMILGHLEGAEPAEAEDCTGSAGWSDELLQAVAESSGVSGPPIAWGLEAGHRPLNRTLPLGMKARLVPVEMRLIVGLESQGEDRNP